MKASFNMKNPSQDHVIGIPINSRQLTCRSSFVSETIKPSSYRSSRSRQNKVNYVIGWMNKLSKRADNLAQGIREHVRLRPKVSETVKGKLSLGAKILQAGGVESVFKKIFSVSRGERLLKAIQCYLSTTAGPIAGLLFISTEKIAFCSERLLTFTLPNGDLARTPYKVIIPLRKLKRVSPSENVNKPTQKYIQIVTVDDFDFWFMGFVSYQKAFKYLQQSITQSSMEFKL
ncbi:GEM-like protein 4 [Acorus calamus]|uniref:GEM-like protein 4 n=1 Tax=Acorus calamus TaxID=4465 RepID=A0AAV9D6V9_ACOCL|nr:GEM-like protein 4 [Acorus calamus]